MENECVCVRARVCVCVGPKNKRITTTGSRTTSQSASFEKPSASFNERVIPSLLLWGGGGGRNGVADWRKVVAAGMASQISSAETYRRNQQIKFEDESFYRTVTK